MQFLRPNLKRSVTQGKALPQRIARRCGFTLLEVILAMSILAIMLGTTFAALRQIMLAKRTLDDIRDARAIAGSVLTRLTRELQLAASDIALLPPREDLTQRYSARNNLLGETDILSDNRRADRIRFMAMEGGQYLPDGSSHSGVVQIYYRLEPNPDLAEPNQSPYLLIREEVPNIRPFERAFEKSMIFPVAKNVWSLSFRYFDSETGEWVDTWGDGNRIHLPSLVQLSMELVSPSGKRAHYATTVPLRAEEEP